MLQQISSKSYESFFEKFVHQAVSYEKELAHLLDYAGCEIAVSSSDKLHEHHFGFKISNDGNATRISKVHPGSIAAKAGLHADDEMISVNNIRIENNLERLCTYFEHEKIHLTIISNKTEKKIQLQPVREKYFKKYNFCCVSFRITSSSLSAVFAFTSQLIIRLPR